jgi:hypothetical protein
MPSSADHDQHCQSRGRGDCTPSKVAHKPVWNQWASEMRFPPHGLGRRHIGNSKPPLRSMSEIYHQLRWLPKKGAPQTRFELWGACRISPPPERCWRKRCYELDRSHETVNIDRYSCSLTGCCCSLSNEIYAFDLQTGEIGDYTNPPLRDQWVKLRRCYDNKPFSNSNSSC